jgi:quinoprotein glucose dehydrogenase
VCLDARTGKLIWHFQIAHHGLWDYDLPSAPNLIDIRVNGKVVKAVAQVTKQAMCLSLTV